MPNTALLNFSDKQAEVFARNLDKVLADLEKRVIDLVSASDAATILNSRAAMLQALTDSGYTALAESHIAKYPDIVEKVKESFAGRDLPAPKFATADAETFKQLATADLEAFAVIGEKAMDDLRLGLYKNALSSAPFSHMVESIRAATVGVAGNGSPLSRYAYAHANTAILSFSGEALRVAGESIGADKWEVVGPLDGVTREECRDALADPVRTEEEWKSAGYFGGTPGGWNCRHQLFPVVEDEEESETPPSSSSIQDAEKWAKDNGIAQNVDYSGIDTDMADRFNRELGGLVNEYPQMRGVSKSIFVIDGAELGPIATNNPDGSIIFNARAFRSDGAFSEAVSGMKKGWAVDPSIEGVIRHEFGHAAYNRATDLMPGPERTKFRMAITRLGGRNKTEIKKGLSLYAASQPGEMVAEMFVAKGRGVKFTGHLAKVDSELQKAWDILK